MKKFLKNKSGITLVALVITIIILLILAGITISQLTENGLFNNTKLAEEKYENSQNDENKKIEEIENIINEYLIGTARNDLSAIESKKIEDFTPIVSGDGKTIKISNPESEDIKGYIYFVGDKVKGVSEDNEKELELENGKTYNTYVFAIDDDGKLKKSNEVSITVGSQINIFNGEETDTAVTGGFNAYYTSSNSWNWNDYIVDTSKYFEIVTCNSGNSGIVVSKNKVNISDLSSIIFNIEGFTNHDNLNTYIYVGISNDNNSNTNFVRNSKLENMHTISKRDLAVNVSDLTGEYYVKLVAYHPTNIADYGVYTKLYSIKANEMVEINNN